MKSAPRTLLHARYYAQQVALFAPLAAAHRVLSRTTGRPARPTKDLVHTLRRRYIQLLRDDARNADAGHYPSELLFQFPLRRYVKQLPGLLREIPRAAKRRATGDYRDLPKHVSLDDYPPYFRRTFHWQTDGYLSERSARLYDLGVEFLFLGAADVMRRQLIGMLVESDANTARTSPGKRAATSGPSGKRRLLDVGCGTGRLLRQFSLARPDLELVGADLSRYYLAEAERVCGAAVEFHEANAERLPFPDASFDVVTSVYLFHELPRATRRHVVRELARVLRPGGILLLQDSAQRSESGELMPALENFGNDFHEPFYRDYLEDDLTELLRRGGFEVDRVASHFVAKSVLARKPLDSRD